MGSRKVVPVYKPEKINAPPASAPHLTYRGGPLISAAEIFSVFWGDFWTQSSQTGQKNNINDFLSFIVQSPLLDQLSEYGVPGSSINRGSFAGASTVTQSFPPVIFGQTLVFDNGIQNMLQWGIQNASFHPPSANTLYFVYLPPGAWDIQGFGLSCLTFCGYHNQLNNQIFYAVVPYPDCSSCMGGMSSFDALTVTSSHELCEAITDPIPGSGWYDDANGEIGDICAWNTKMVGSYIVQKEWSNSNNSCI